LSKDFSTQPQVADGRVADREKHYAREARFYDFNSLPSSDRRTRFKSTTLERGAQNLSEKSVAPHDDRFNRREFNSPGRQLGRGYMHRDWESPDFINMDPARRH
jgi:hypothetical protein